MTKTNNNNTQTRNKTNSVYIPDALISKMISLDTMADPQTAGTKLGFIGESTARIYMSITRAIDKAEEKISERQRLVKKLKDMLLDPDKGQDVSNSDIAKIEYAPEYYAKYNTKIEIFECILDFIDIELVQPLRGSNLTEDMIKKDQAILDSLGGGANTSRADKIAKILGKKPLVEVTNK